MGCASSKLDDLPAVALCRQRCTFIDEAIHQRYAFAQAHVAYLHSLKAVGVSLDRFLNQDLAASVPGPSSPVLNLPAQRKGYPPEPSGSPPEKISHHHHLHSHSDSGSHLHFHSDSDGEDDSGSESLHHPDAPSPVRPYGGHIGYMPDYETLHGDGGFMHMNYMKKHSTPSVVYQQRPMIPETIHMGESSTSSYPSHPYPYSNNNQNPASYPYYNTNQNIDNNYANYPTFGAGGEFFSSSMPPAPYGGFSSPPSGSAGASSSSKPTPPPPSPPSGSAWVFLNPFDTFEKYYPTYTPSRDSREVREEEGIPDLEDEDDEVVKEVHGNQKFVGRGRSGYSKAGTGGTADEVENERVVNDEESQYRAKPGGRMESDPMEYEVHMVDKEVVDAEDRLKDRGNVAGFKSRGGFKGDSEVMREIRVQFERASESGNELSKLLEVGKLPYKHKHIGRHVPSKILHLPAVSSQNLTSKSSEIDKSDPTNLDVDQAIGSSSRNISSTLHKLYLWEKKLYEEVKVEEKMRVLHDRKSRKLKRLDARGAEAQKVDATRALVRSLSTKIRIAIQVVDKISVKINSLRDDELWPQINEFIHGLTRMWKSMLECHHNQCEAIGEAKWFDAIASLKHLTDAHFEATQQLEHDLIDWTLRFSYWVRAQNGYVRALNNWLMKCLLYVPEETADGIVPFSPGRIGAPPVFVICYQWSQSLVGISEKEVVDSMRDFATTVLQLWDRDKLEMRQRMLANKDERKVKGLEREDQKIHKEIQALDKRMVLTSGDDSGLMLNGRAVYQSETSKSGSLQASLQRVFKAMERYMADTLKVYEELLQRIEEDHLAREHAQVS